MILFGCTKYGCKKILHKCKGGEIKIMQKYMTYKQAMLYLNIGSYNTLYKFIKLGLKVSIIGGVKRIDQQEADKFMKQKSI